MAVLKDLIVHGPSRFLNKSYFNTINAKSVGADQGIFKKLIATSLEAEEATIDNLTADNAIVTGLLDVQGELHTNAWTNANIANIGGSFYISPTVEPTDGTTTISITRNSATSWTISATGTFATDFIKSGTATSGVAWPANSLVLITGDVVVGDMVYPLGTLKGTLNAQVTATAASTSKTITITGVTDAQNNNAPSVLQELYSVNNNTNISNAPFKKGKISLYKLGSNPIGILMTSMGTNSNSLIDIFGGTETTPNVRIGHLGALSSYTDSAGNTRQPSGWGIYTDNGFFKGVVVADSGSIGHFTIDSNAIYSGEHSAYNTSGKNGIFIGRPNSSSSDYYVSGGPGALWYLKSDGSAKIGQMTLSTAGVLALGSISLNASGTASIGPWVVNNTSIYKRNATYGTSGSGNMYFGNNGLSISSTFKVSSAGALTATSADVTGAIKATSGYFGNTTNNNITISANTSNAAIYSKSHSTLASTGDGFYIGSDGISIGSKFKYTGGTTNTLILDTITATNFSFSSGSIDGSVTIGGTKTASTVLSDITNAAGTASNYIAYINATDGIKVAAANPSSTTSNYVQITSSDVKIVRDNTHKTTIDSTGMKVYAGDASNPVAQYGSTITIGKETSGNLRTKIDGDTFWITNGTIDIAFIGNENRQITDTFVSDGTTTTFTLSSSVASGGIVSPSSVVVSRSGTTLTVSSGLPAAGESFTYTYTPTELVRYYTMGTRLSTKNYGYCSFAEGYEVVASGPYSHAEGVSTTASGSCSHAEGLGNIASGSSSHAEGQDTLASGYFSHAEGTQCQATLSCCHAEGYLTVASGECSHAEGNNTTARGNCAHAEGYHTDAHGYAHAEGFETNALGYYSHTQNRGTQTDRTSQTVIGEYNEIDTADTTSIRDPEAAGNTNIHYGKYAFIIGNGTSSDNPSNALTVDWDGNLECNNVGAFYNATSVNATITTANIDTFVAGASLTLPAGTYVLNGTWIFQAGTSTGTRNLECRITDSSGTIINDGRTRVLMGANNYAILQATAIAELSAGTYYIRGSSSMKTNSAGATFLRAVRIK